MSYATIDDLKKVLPEAELIRLTDDAAAGSMDTAKAQEALDSAAEEIDAYIGGRVGLPVMGTVPPILGKLSADLAVYNLYSRVQTEVPETWGQRRKEAVRLLEKIGKGEISLGIQPPPNPPDKERYADRVRTKARTQVFSETELDKY